MLNKLSKKLKERKIDLENWTVLSDESQLEDVLEASQSRPQLIYKHSTTCGICVIVKRKFEKRIGELSEKASLNYVNVIDNRDISNTIAETLGVRHESPQVLIVKNGGCLWHESHFSIKADSILEVLREEESAV